MINSFVNNMKYHVRCELYNQTGTNKIELRFTEPENLFINDIEITFPDLTHELRLTLDGTVSPQVHKIAFYNGGGVLLDTLNLDDSTAEYYPVDVFTFDGIYLSFGSTIPSNPNVTWAWLLQATWEYFSLTLYNLTCEKNVVTKTSYLSNARLVRGQLEEETDITKPSVLLDTGNWIIDLFKYNYVYIPLFKRYYFIDKIVSVRMNIYRIYLSVDVLYTYDSDIRLQDVFVTRNENTYRGTQVIVDNRIPLEDKPIVEYSSPASGTLVNTTFNDLNFVNDYSATAIIMNDMNISTMYDSFNPPTGLTSDLPYVNGGNLSSSVYVNYIIQPKDCHLIQYTVRNTASLASYVASLICFPFSLKTTIDVNSNDDIAQPPTRTVRINTTDVVDEYSNVVKGYLAKGESSGYHIIADFTPTGKYSDNLAFLNYEPFAMYEYFLPFYGWIQLKSYDILNKNIIIYFVVDYATGVANYYVYSVTDKKILYTCSCQMGIKCSISTTNMEEITKQRQANAMNLMLGLIGGGISTAVGIATGNPIAIAGGVLSVGKSIASAVNTNAMLIERANVSIGGDKLGWFTGTKVVVKLTYKTTLSQSDMTVFEKLNGYIVNDYCNITTDSITGYTEIGEMHYTPSALTYITKLEMDEIVSIARDGIIL